MRAGGWLDPVRSALDAAPHPVRIFFRDDDAGWADDALARLIAIFRARGAPLDLAVIPCALTPPLARRLARDVEHSDGLVALHQHGYAHLNHERIGRKHEFGPSRSAAEQRADIAAGQQKLRALLAGAVQPIFTPPWNRCTANTATCLVELGFRVLSRDVTAPAIDATPLRELRVSVDWLTGRKGVRVGVEEQARALAAQLAAPEPVGVMLHHAVMNAEAMHAIADLLDVLAAHPAVRWSTMGAMASASPAASQPAREPVRSRSSAPAPLPVPAGRLDRATPGEPAARTAPGREG